MNQYEAMFLFDPTFAASFENCESEIRRIMERAEAEILFCKKWDERRLTFKIKGRKRGTYVLVYFKAPPGKIAGVERDARLSENVLRVLVIRADGITPEMMEKAVAPRAAESEGEGEGRTPREGDFGDGRPDRRRRRPRAEEGDEKSEIETAVSD